MTLRNGDPLPDQRPEERSVASGDDGVQRGSEPQPSRPIFQDFSRSLVQGIVPVLQDLQQQITRVIDEQVAQVLPPVEGRRRRAAQASGQTAGLHGGEDTRQRRPDEAVRGEILNRPGDEPAVTEQLDASNERQQIIRAEPANLADLLERVLDKGIVIAGDITLSLGDIELLTLRIRLLIASVDKAEQIAIDWWRSDAALSSQAKREQLEDRIRRLEA